MRCYPVLALLALTPLFAQDSQQSSPPIGHWTFGVLREAPDFSGNYAKVNGSGTDTSYDTNADLGLTKGTTGVGGLIEYEGRRFLLHLAAYSQTYNGNQVTTDNITINNTTITAGSQVVSQLKLKDYELDWTIKVWRWDRAYLGLDLGFNAWSLNVNAVGTVSGGDTSQTQTAAGSVTVPIPQIGASLGAHVGYLDFRGYYNFLSRSGATYHRAGADVRFYPLKWLGVQANVENEGFKVPKGSIDQETTLNITKNGVGFGVVARF